MGTDKLFFHWWNEPSHARLDYIKRRFIGKWFSGDFTGHKEGAQGSCYGKREGVEGEEEERKSVCLCEVQEEDSGLYREAPLGQGQPSA